MSFAAPVHYADLGLDELRAEAIRAIVAALWIAVICVLFLVAVEPLRWSLEPAPVVAGLAITALATRWLVYRNVVLAAVALLVGLAGTITAAVYSLGNGLYAAAYPIATVIAGMLLGRKIFKDKGVPLPPTKWGDPKWDWNAFLETAKKLTYGEGAQKVFGVAGNTWWVYMHPWIWSNGGAVVLPDNKTVVLDSPEAVEAWEFYAALILQHKVMPIAAQATEGPDQLFESNRAAMDINNTSYTIRMRQMKDFDWDMAPFPTAKTGKVFDRVPNNVVSGYAKTKYPEESWQFLKFMGSKDATADARGMPARYSVANSDDFLKRTPNQNWQLLVDSGPIRKSEVLSPYFGEFDNTLRAAWESVQGGNKTVKQMVQEMKPKLTDILAGKTSQ